MTARAKALCVGSVHGERGAIPCNCEAIEAALVEAGRRGGMVDRLSAILLGMAANRFSNDGCGEVDIREWGFTAAECLEISEGCWRQNGSHDDERGDISDSGETDHWVLMLYVADLLKGGTS